MARPSLKNNVAKPQAAEAAEVARRLAQGAGAAQAPAQRQDEADTSMDYETVSFHIHAEMRDLITKLASLRLELDKRAKRAARRSGEKPPQARKSGSAIVRDALEAYRPKIEAEIEELQRLLGPGV